jgi:hypothetical protein
MKIQLWCKNFKSRQLNNKDHHRGAIFCPQNLWITLWNTSIATVFKPEKPMDIYRLVKICTVLK